VTIEDVPEAPMSAMFQVECDCPGDDASGGRYMHKLMETVRYPNRAAFISAGEKCFDCGAPYRIGDHE